MNLLTIYRANSLQPCAMRWKEFVSMPVAKAVAKVVALKKMML
jgi:hypothetical protein